MSMPSSRTMSAEPSIEEGQLRSAVEDMRDDRLEEISDPDWHLAESFIYNQRTQRPEPCFSNQTPRDR